MTAARIRLGLKLLLLLFMGAWLFVDSALVEPRNLQVETVEAAMPGWPADAAPVRVVLLADIHATLWDDAWLDRVVETTESLQPELIILLGDYCFTGGKRWFAMPPERAVLHLAPLLRQCPVYYVGGNHDLFQELLHVHRVLGRSGFISLESGEDQTVTFSNGCAVRLRGGPFVPETDSGLALRKRFALEKAPAKGQEAKPPLISVIHNPYHFLRHRMAGDLILCGHTHGGQICFPGRIPLRKQGNVSVEMLRAGWHRAATGKPLYISRGVGSTLIPLRLNCPPEITLLYLKGGAS